MRRCRCLCRCLLAGLALLLSLRRLLSSCFRLRARAHVRWHVRARAHVRRHVALAHRAHKARHVCGAQVHQQECTAVAVAQLAQDGAGAAACHAVVVLQRFVGLHARDALVVELEPVARAAAGAHERGDGARCAAAGVRHHGVQHVARIRHNRASSSIMRQEWGVHVKLEREFEAVMHLIRFHGVVEPEAQQVQHQHGWQGCEARGDGRLVIPANRVCKAALQGGGHVAASLHIQRQVQEGLVVYAAGARAPARVLEAPFNQCVDDVLQAGALQLLAQLFYHHARKHRHIPSYHVILAVVDCS